MNAGIVEIHYRRLPDQERIFRQAILHEGADYVVTFLENTPLSAALTIEGRIVLEAGSPVIWFTYPGRWYDIGRFHLPDGTFTGTYANILTPVEMRPGRWATTDLCLDVWLGSDRQVRVLDEAEFADAVERGWMEAPTAAIAREQAGTLAAAARRGAFPPAHVEEWTLERARRIVRG